MKTVLITGASRGIGRACAEEFAAKGCKVIINYNNSEKLALSLAEKLGARAIKADVSDLNAVKAMFEAAGEIDTLVCCAGIASQELFTDVTPEMWRRMFAVNMDGVYNCCRCAVPGMIHNKSGNIITVSSVWGITGASCEVAYSASKSAVIGFSKALAKELGPSGIRVNCIAPGVIDTDMNAMHSKETMNSLCEETPLGVIGKPIDIAKTAVFLASDDASFITGQVISPNGGFLI